MMKLFVATLLIATATAGRLDNTYLPPSNAGTAGGNATVLATPLNLLTANHVATNIASPASIYTSPVVTHGFGPIPSILYGAPVAPHLAGAVYAPGALSGISVASYSGPVTPPIPILRLYNENNGDGSYRFEYETANHIAAQESGHQKTADSSEVQGSYSYLAPNGQVISVSYIADENGFRPAGEHLPTPPPIPAAILKSLEINAAEEARGVVDDGRYRRSAAELILAGRSPAVSSQYLPPVTEGGYKY